MPSMIAPPGPSEYVVKIFSNQDPARIARKVKDILEEAARIHRTSSYSDPASTRCSKCQEDFPYAEARVRFVCWGCKNYV